MLTEDVKCKYTRQPSLTTAESKHLAEQENKIFRKIEPLVRQIYERLTTIAAQSQGAALTSQFIAKKTLSPNLRPLAETIHQLIIIKKTIFGRDTTLPYELQNAYYFIPLSFERNL